MTSPVRERRRPVAGRVVSVRPIPEADNVHLAMVDIGGARLQIVFGGSRTDLLGQIVPVAPPGSWVPGPGYRRWAPVKMRRRRYRGHDSYGMLCSLRELGWAAASQDRVPFLDTGLEPGSPLPEFGGWRHIVIDPPTADFEPNTAELSVFQIRALLDLDRQR